MILSRLNRALMSNELLLKGGCVGSSAMQRIRLTLPSRRLFAQNGQKTGTNAKQNAKIVMSVIPFALAGGYFLYCCAKVAYFEYRISATTISKLPPIAKEDYVDRSEEKETLRELIMKPHLLHYHVYQGPRGAGKTHALMEVVDELRKEGVKGVHYVSAESPLHRSLAKTLSMNHPVVIYGLFNGFLQSPRSALDDHFRCRDIFQRLGASAKEYEDGRVTTIIVDGINNVVPNGEPNDGPGELTELLDIAKLHTDYGKIHWILVDSSMVALHTIDLHGSWSTRMKWVFSRDVGEKDAKDFLKRHVEAAGKKFDVDEVYNVTGGRIGLLKKAVSLLQPVLPSQEGGVLRVTTQEELIQALLEVPTADLKAVFPSWPRINESYPVQEFQYRILRILAEKPDGVEKTGELHWRAKWGEYHAKGVDCRLAIRQLLRNDLIRYVERSYDLSYQLHSHAIKYLALKNERDPFKAGGDDEIK